MSGTFRAFFWNALYKFRGNDSQGLAKIEAHLGDGTAPLDVSITECQRSPKAIVVAANQLMALSGVQALQGVGRDRQLVVHIDRTDADRLAMAQDATCSLGREAVAIEGDFAPRQGGTQVPNIQPATPATM